MLTCKKTWYNKYIHEKKELSKTGIISTKNTEEITTIGPTPLKETGTTRLLKYHKKQIITKQIMDNSKNIKELFRIVNSLAGSYTHNPLPPGKMTEEIAEGFADFSNKITKI